MTVKDLVPEMMRLPLHERLFLLEALLRSVREELETTPKRQAVIPFEALGGVLKPDGKMPTDEELRDDYTDYLIRKYA